jgi:hypothetical protein
MFGIAPLNRDDCNLRRICEMEKSDWFGIAPLNRDDCNSGALTHCTAATDSLICERNGKSIDKPA